jgi:hypothetical protein
MMPAKFEQEESLFVFCRTIELLSEKKQLYDRLLMGHGTFDTCHLFFTAATETRMTTTTNIQTPIVHTYVRMHG